MLKAIHCQPLFMKQQVLQEKEQPQPKYFCVTCTKLKNGNYCDCFQRHVEPNYNRCFYHSNYKPKIVKFKTSENLESIIKEEEKQTA